MKILALGGCGRMEKCVIKYLHIDPKLFFYYVKKGVGKNFLLNTDNIQAEHGFVSMIPNKKKGFFVSWLDGRNTVEKTENNHYKPMTIRFAEVTEQGEVVFETELDKSVCDCCQTSIAMSKSDPIVVYRDRSSEEIRDIYSIRSTEGVWQEPKPVHSDGWRVNGCPVNGPKIAVHSTKIAVAWFTVIDDHPLVNVAFSSSGRDTFDAPLRLSDKVATGRVDLTFLNANELLVSYMEIDNDDSYLRVKRVSIDGQVSDPFTISKIDGARSTGVPQLEVINNEIFVVWTTSTDGKQQLKSVKFSPDNIRSLSAEKRIASI